MRFPLFRLAVILSIVTASCSGCSAFDSANVTNADPKISFERAQEVAQDNNIKCLWAAGADPKTGNYHCVPIGRAGHADTQVKFAQIGLRVAEGGVKLPEAALIPLRVVTIDGRVELTPLPIEQQTALTETW